MRPTITRFLITGISLFLFSFPMLAQETPPIAWTPELQMKLKTPGTPRISPDGRRIVYTVTSAVMSPDKSEYNTQLWMASTDGKENAPLTSGDKSSSNPQWSPDGSTIAFTSNRNNNRNNVFLLQLATSKLTQLTDLKGAISYLEFSPDGKSIVFVMTDPKSEEEEKNEKAKNDYRWVDENIKMSRIYLVSADTGMVKPEPVKLTTENYNVTALNWSPDGKYIVFSHSKKPGQEYGSTSDLSILDLTTRMIKPLLITETSELVPRFTPDSKYVLYVGGSWPKLDMTNQFTFKLIPVNGGPIKSFAIELDGRTEQFAGFGTDDRFYYTQTRGTQTSIFALDYHKGKVEETSSGGVCSAISLNLAGKFFGFVKQTLDKPAEIYVASVNNLQPVQISRINEALVLPAVPRTEIIRWKSTDGKEIEGLLTYPVNYQKGQKVPLLLEIHGGPNGNWNQSFTGNATQNPLASMAAAGIAVLRPNPRGSTGYSTSFRRGVIRDLGGGDYEDLMTGVDKVIGMGIADPDRLGVMGWSYGGFMTNWMITHTKRFKAASSGAGLSDLFSMVALTDFPGAVSQYLESEYWDDPIIYQKHSPISYIKNAITPTLLQHGEADPRVPVSQGYEMYYALKKRGVPVKMLVLPRQPHVPSEPKMNLIIMQSNLDWFLKYLVNPEKSLTDRK